MSNNKLLKENTIRRFMKLANVDSLTDTFIQETYRDNLLEQEEPEEPEMPEPEGDDAMDDDVEMDDDMDMEDDMGMEGEEEELGAADISLTEEEAELLIDLGERLKAAMGEGAEEDMDMDDDMDMEDDMEDDMGDMDAAEDAGEEEEAAGYRGMRVDADSMMQEELVNEVLKRVTKRIISERNRR